MTVHTGRHFLQIPGPTNVPDRVLRAMDMPAMDHRGAEFAEIGHAVLAALLRDHAMRLAERLERRVGTSEVLVPAQRLEAHGP